MFCLYEMVQYPVAEMYAWAVQNTPDSSGLRTSMCIFTGVIEAMCGMVLTSLGLVA